MSLLSKVLDEHFLAIGISRRRQDTRADRRVAHGSHGDDEGRVARALYDILVQLNNLLDSGYWSDVSLFPSERHACLDVLGRALCPVISSGSLAFFGGMIDSMLAMLGYTKRELEHRKQTFDTRGDLAQSDNVEGVRVEERERTRVNA